ASSGTRTGPWKRQPQQNLSSSYRCFTGGSPAFLGGYATSTTGTTPLGNAEPSPCWLRTTTQQPCSAFIVPTCPRSSVGLSPVTKARSDGTFQLVISGPIVSGP